MILGSVGVGATLLNLHDPLIAAQLKGNRSIIWVWLGGGPTHFETFNASSNKSGFESVIGQLEHQDSPIKPGGLWHSLMAQRHSLNVVGNFSHTDASHSHATHWMNGAHYNPDRPDTAISKYPSHGSITAAMFGVTNNVGVPTYVSQGKIDGDAPAWLGGAFKGFDPSAKDNLSPRVEVDRFTTRRNLLEQLDQVAIASDSGVSANKYRAQAYDVVLGDAKKAFDDAEWAIAKSVYGDSDIGRQLWLAQRLVSFGSRFVTIHYGGWDMHSDIKKGLENLVPKLDGALGATIKSLTEQGMLKDTMIIVTGEFGRTKYNATNGRDHWPSITPLLIAGGDTVYNRVIGEPDEYNYVPKNSSFGPIDLQRTMFDHLGIDISTQRVDNGGRPRYLLEGVSKNILS